MNDHPMFGHTSAAISRRDLLKGGALIVGFAMAGSPQGATAATRRGRRAHPIRAG